MKKPIKKKKTIPWRRKYLDARKEAGNRDAEIYELRCQLLNLQNFEEARKNQFVPDHVKQTVMIALEKSVAAQTEAVECLTRLASLWVK